MFYFFSKVFTYFITPAGWLTAALLVAWFSKEPLRRRRLIGLAFGIFWLFGNAFLVNELTTWWEYPPAPVPTDSSAHVAVLLTGGMVNSRKPTPNGQYLLSREADRAGQALYLYKRGAVQKILISGGSGSLPFQPKSITDEGQMTAQFLRMAGVRAQDIVLEGQSRNTHENALFSAQVLRRQFQTNRCVLVTSAFHMRRSVGCFRRQGLLVTPFPGNFLSSEPSYAPAEWLLPNAESFANSYYLMKELIGYLTYWVVGYL